MLRSRFTLLAIGLMLLLGFAGLFGRSFLTRKIQQPFAGYSDTKKYFTLDKGETISQIAERLRLEGIVESAWLFEWYGRLSFDDFSPKAGEYRFVGPLSLAQVADVLQEGKIHYHKVTVPEGLDWRETIQLFVQSGFGSEEVFKDLVWNPERIMDLDGRADNLEGYLFPETYLLARGTSEETIIQLMVGNLRRIWTPDRQAKAESFGWGLREVLTLASLIEEETRLSSERPLVSAVFHNRLERAMNLACDPSVIYAVKLVKEYDGVLNKSDLEMASPYNTYLNPGLPPGPIANPGLASIDAALAPAQVDHLFFVSKNDGSHFFSSQYRDHQRAVQEYQR